MKRALTHIISLGVISSSLVLVGCDWSSGGDSAFNTSRANLQVNVSGVYRGQQNGKAVSNPSAGNITQLVVQQSGNVLELTDNQGSTYRGNVGIPATLGTEDTTIPLGAELASFQVSWNGNDNVSGKQIRFTGVMSLVAVEDISGTETLTAQGADTLNTVTAATINDTATQTQNGTTTQDGVNGTTTSETVDQQGQGGTQTGNGGQTETALTATTTTTTRDSTFGTANTSSTAAIDTTTGQTTDQTASGNTDIERTVGVRTFNVADNNSQMRLSGAWIEDGGGVSTVNAIGRIAGGIFTIPIAIGLQEGAATRETTVTSTTTDINAENVPSTIP